jgi:hypothetical protein
MFKAYSFLVVTLLLSVSALAGWSYYGDYYHKGVELYPGSYALESGCESCKDTSLDKVVLREFFHKEIPMIITIGAGYNYSTVTAPVTYKNRKQDSFKFDIEQIDECQDPGCAGVAAAKGHVYRKSGVFDRYIEITFTFYREVDDNGKMKTWRETGVYKLERGNR